MKGLANKGRSKYEVFRGFYPPLHLCMSRELSLDRRSVRSAQFSCREHVSAFRPRNLMYNASLTEPELLCYEDNPLPLTPIKCSRESWVSHRCLKGKIKFLERRLECLNVFLLLILRLRAIPPLNSFLEAQQLCEHSSAELQ